jgi:hypothetical protein
VDAGGRESRAVSRDAEVARADPFQQTEVQL